MYLISGIYTYLNLQTNCMRRCHLATNPEKGNKPNNISKQQFAMDADENKIVISAVAFLSVSAVQNILGMHFKVQEKEASPLTY